MRLAALIALIGGLVFLAHLFAAIFSRTRIPDVLWLLLIGVGLGPAFHLLSPAAFGVVGLAFVSITWRQLAGALSRAGACRESKPRR